MPFHIGVSGEVRKLKELPCGVDGEVRTIKEAYCGVDGEVRKVFSKSSNLLEKVGSDITWYGGYYIDDELNEDCGIYLPSSSNKNVSIRTKSSNYENGQIILTGSLTTYVTTFGVIGLYIDFTNIKSITINFTKTNSNQKLYHYIGAYSTYTNLTSSFRKEVTIGVPIDVSTYTGYQYLWLGNIGLNSTVNITEIIAE